MRIRSKMFALVTSAMGFMALIAGSYLVSQGSSSRIEAERRVLVDLSTSIKDLIGAVNMLDSDEIGSAGARFEGAKDKASKCFDEVDRLTYLPRVNASLKESIEVIRNLRALASDDLASLSSSFEALKGDAKQYFLSDRETRLRQFYTDEYARKKYDLSAVYKRLDEFSTLSAGLTDTLIMSSDVVAEKEGTIDGELRKAAARSIAIAATIAAGLFALAIAIAFRVSRSLALPIVSIEESIRSLATGDLTGRISVRSRDELGALGGELNSFLDSLAESIAAIKRVARENDELKESLIRTVDGASSSATEIDANAGSIKRQVEGLDARIVGARESLSAMERGIEEYAGRAARQEEMVASSSASLEEVLGSIDSIGRIAEGDSEAAAVLVKATAEGRVVFGEAFGGLAEIARSVDDVNDMASVIRAIASRTNLLAMNAAIEAAHAGDSGRGFAVVADEIRKLATEASESSKRIGDTIRTVGERMMSAASAKDKATASFEAMDARITGVTSSAKEIDRLLAEIRAKARGVQDLMAGLREMSKSTAEGAEDITAASSSLGEAVTEVARVSQEVRSNIDEIAAGLEEISSSVQAVSLLAGDLGDAGARLDSAIDAFVLEKPEDGTPAEPAEPAPAKPAGQGAPPAASVGGSGGR